VSEDIMPYPNFNGLFQLKRFLFTVLFITLFALSLFLNEKGILGTQLQLSSPFRIQQVKIVTEWPLTVSEIQAWLPPLEGKSLITLSSKDLVFNLQQRPWVENVIVKKQFPDRLWIEIQTARPRALAVIKESAFFIDAHGKVIDKARPRMLKSFDLPFLTLPQENSGWNVSEVLAVIEQFRSFSKAKYSISQVVLDNYPYFKIFLDSPKLEILLSLETWKSQTTVLETLLSDPPSQNRQVQRINLIFPKKAVVSSHN
jgi:cell division septal protein FtsQ